MTRPEGEDISMGNASGSGVEGNNHANDIPVPKIRKPETYKGE